MSTIWNKPPFELSNEDLIDAELVDWRYVRKSISGRVLRVSAVEHGRMVLIYSLSRMMALFAIVGGTLGIAFSCTMGVIFTGALARSSSSLFTIAFLGLLGALVFSLVVCVMAIAEGIRDWRAKIVLLLARDSLHVLITRAESHFYYSANQGHRVIGSMCIVRPATSKMPKLHELTIEISGPDKSAKVLLGRFDDESECMDIMNAIEELFGVETSVCMPPF